MRKSEINLPESYEEFVERARNVKPYALERLAMYGSSLVLSIYVAMYGLLNDQLNQWPFYGSAVAGGILTLIIWYWENSKHKALKELPKINLSESG